MMTIPKMPPIPPMPSVPATTVHASATPVEPDGSLDVNEQHFILTGSLTKKHRADPIVLAFIDNFIRCKSVAQAADETGIKYSLAYTWRHSADISECIQRLEDRSHVKFNFNASEIVQRVKEVVDFDPISMQNADGSFKSNLADIEPEARRALKKLKVKNLFSESKDLNGMSQKIIIGEIIEYEFYDKLKASELVGREKDIFKNKSVVEHGVTKDMANILLEASRRGDQEQSNFRPADVIETSYTTEESDDDNE